MGSSVTVVITAHCRDQLADAVASVAAQTHPPAEIIVVAGECLAEPLAGAFPIPVRRVQPHGRGAAAARNSGLRAARSEYVQFLDEADVLTPVALAAGLACFDRHPDAALVWGAHRRVDLDGRPLGPRSHGPGDDGAFAAFLQGLVVPTAAVLYRRDVLDEAGGFTEGLRGGEDYALHLGLARRHPVAWHTKETVLRRCATGQLARGTSILRPLLHVHRAHRPAPTDPPDWRRAWRAGRRNLREHVARAALADARATRRPWPATALLVARLSPRLLGRLAAHRVARRLVNALPGPVGNSLARRRPTLRPPALGTVRLGDLDRTEPVSLDFGFDRGRPVDRHYIEQFLHSARADIRGRVLEVGDATYSERFGQDAIERQDILHVHPGNPAATIVGDITLPGVLPRAAFDCIVLTQTLHLIYDMSAAVAQLHAALRPGGVLLMTVPGISQIDRGEWGAQWYWALTPAAVRRLLGEFFGEAAVTVEGHGNVYAATAFLQGLALSEIDVRKLDVRDEAYPLIVTAHAQKWSRELRSDDVGEGPLGTTEVGHPADQQNGPRGSGDQ